MAITRSDRENRIPFEPDWAVHPGEMLEEHLEVRGLTQAEFARRTGLGTKVVSTIISGQNPVTPATALAFENVLGMKAVVWTNLQSQWDLFEERKRRAPSVDRAKAFVSRFPIKALSDARIVPKSSDANVIVQALLDFFGVASIEAYDVTVSRLAVAHREARGAKATQDFVFSWLKMGEHCAKSMNLPAFDSSKFYVAVKSARKLTKKSPQEFWPMMVDDCKNAGAALLLQEPFTGMKVYGSTYWLETGNAVIQLSLRHKTNDHFWFTFFHECGHVLRHPKRNFVDGGDGQQCDKQELEANAFAEEILYGAGGSDSVRHKCGLTDSSVKRVADEYDLHAGIVVGTLQHYHDVHFSRLNELKEKFALVKK